MPIKYAPLKVANPTEKKQDWDAVMRELPMLAEWIERTFAVDITDIADESKFVTSTEKPEGSDSELLWVKISSPPGIGIPFGNEYTVIYPYPPNVPFLWVSGDDSLPTYLRKLTSDELDNYELDNPVIEDYFHVILEP